MNADKDENSDYSDLEDDNSDFVPEDIRKKAEVISLKNLPDKSKKDYVARYNHFKKWRKDNVKSNSFDDDVVLVYFDFLAQAYAPPSLWVYYSQLKATFAAFHHLDISSYKRVILFLKKKMCRYVVRKSAVFTKENIITFLSKASDDIHLVTKVSLIFGIAGALRRKEFTTMKIDDLSFIEDRMLHVRAPTTETGRPRSFTIEGVLLDIVKEYIAARPGGCETNRFFLNYQNGKCTKQPIPINKFGSMPRVIAEVLKIANASEFTGHSFRRTSATLLVDASADMTTLKRHGDWKSNSVVEGYIAESIQNKRKIYNQITEGIILDKKVKSDNDAAKKLSSSNLRNHLKITSIVSMQNSSQSVSNKIDSTKVLVNHNSNILNNDQVIIKKKEILPNLKKSSVFNFAEACTETTKPISNIFINALSPSSTEPPSRVHQSFLRDTIIEDEVMNTFGVNENSNLLKRKSKGSEQTSNGNNSEFASGPRTDLSTIFDQIEHLTSGNRPVYYHPDRGLYVENEKNVTFLNCTFNIQM